MELGIGSYTYPWAVGIPGYEPKERMTHETLLDKAIDLGVSVVQYCENLPLSSLLNPALDALVRRARANGVRFEIGVRGLSRESLDRGTELAVCVGSPILRLVIDSHQDQPTAEEVRLRLSKNWPQFEDRGVKLAIENHDRLPARVLANIITTLNPNSIGVCLDTANSLGCLEGTETTVEVLAPHALCLHVKDVSANRISSMLGFRITGTAAGEGMVDIPRVLQQVGAAGKCQSVILESWPEMISDQPPIDREEKMASQGIGYLRSLGI